MSGSVVGQGYTFLASDVVDIRRFCGYPPYGTGVVIFPEPWYFRFYLALETRITNLTAPEATVVQTYLGNLRTLESAIPAAAANLDTDKAAVWTHNKSEVKDRMSLYRQWRVELCHVMGIPPGPYLKTAGIRLVV